jgi:aminopeptidase N
LDKYNFGFIQKNGSGKSSVYINFQSLYRADTNALNYLLYPTLWKADQFNNFFNLGIQHRYSYYRGTGNIHLGFRSTALGSDYDYAKVQLEVINNNNLGRIAIKTRTFMQFGTGERWAPESELYLAGGNPEALMNNKYTRSQIVTNDEWLGYGSYTNHLHSGGGLNLRGYAGYLVAQANKGDTNDIRVAYKGNTGGAVNIEIEFDKLLGLKFWALRDYLKFKTYFFGDIGLINYNTIYEDLAFTDLRADAGLGAALTIKKWGPLDLVKPLTIRFDMPFFLNRPPSTDADFFQFRWVVGINRCF